MFILIKGYMIVQKQIPYSGIFSRFCEKLAKASRKIFYSFNFQDCQIRLIENLLTFLLLCIAALTSRFTLAVGLPVS